MIPWWFKFGFKLFGSYVPPAARLAQKLGYYRHGAMDRAEYVADVASTHLRAMFEQASHAAGFTCLELGPGDSVMSAVVARAHGAARTILIDSGDFAQFDAAQLRRLLEHLERNGRPLSLPPCATQAELLAACGSEYLTQGLQSLQQVQAQSVDFVWSHAVLEHVARAHFDATIAAMARAMKIGGLASHRVDLQDHLGGSINHLRFSSQFWERPRVASAGFYTNRLRMREILHSMRTHQLQIVALVPDRWSELPVARERLAAEFAAEPEDELRVLSFDVILRRER